MLSCCPSVIRAIHRTVPSAECKLSTLSSVFLCRMPNEVTSHCFWHAQEHLTGVGVLEAMAKMTSVSGPDVCGPSTQTSQVDIIVKALPMCYPNGLIVLHGPSAGAFHFYPCVPFRFLSKPHSAHAWDQNNAIHRVRSTWALRSLCANTATGPGPFGQSCFVRVFQLWVSSKHDRWRA